MHQIAHNFGTERVVIPGGRPTLPLIDAGHNRSTVFAR